MNLIGENSILIGQLIAFQRSPGYGDDGYGYRYVFRDHLGSTSVVINGKGEELWKDYFLPFGDVRYTYKNAADMPVQTQYRPSAAGNSATGQWFEDGVGATSPVSVDGQEVDRGLYFYGARWYDSSLGRFIQPDTIVPSPSDPQSLNRYSSVLNNPLRYSDPSGHCIVQHSGDVRMGEYPYGTGGVCANTGSTIAEGTAAIEKYHNDPSIATPTEELLFWYIGGPAMLVGAVEFAAAIPAIVELLTPTASAACADGDCTNEMRSGSSVIDSLTKANTSQTISWLENQTQRVEHIMSPGHAWSLVADMGDDLLQNYRNVQPAIQQVIDTGTRTVGRGYVEYRGIVNGQEIVVRGRDLINGVFEISNAFVQTLPR